MQIPPVVRVIALAFAFGTVAGCIGSTLFFSVARVGRAVAGVQLCDR